MVINVKENLNLLGRHAKDKVTNFQGVITSIAFDLYGCNQALLNPGIDNEGKLRDQNWFDINRLEVAGSPIMEAPEFDTSKEKGAESKPAFKN
jgi:hypothetical protein